MRNMWYVIQVYTGSENKIAQQCRKYIPESSLKKTFIPRYKEPRKVQGAWIMREKTLFPGYVFLDIEDWETALDGLREVNGPAKLLTYSGELLPLTEEELWWIRDLCGDEQAVGISTGIIEGTQVIVKSGPLVGKEGYIRKIDRHKRRAYLEIIMFGRIQKVQIGLEIVRKV